MHYHVFRNVSGYLPDSDEAAYPFETEADAQMALDDELNTEIDNEESEERISELQEIKDSLSSTTGGFLTYSSTHADSNHDIPTGWQIIPCTESE